MNIRLKAALETAALVGWFSVIGLAATLVFLYFTAPQIAAAAGLAAAIYLILLIYRINLDRLEAERDRETHG